jgi:phosphomannomutase
MLQPLEYRCPGEAYSIDRAIHLGRLAAFDPRCRRCPHRSDTGSLPVRLMKELQATWQHSSPALFDERGVRGTLGEGLDAALVRQIAVAFGGWLQQTNADPSVVVTHDGRSTTAELVAAASDGLRWSGCEVIEVPAATSACLTFTQLQLGADAALLVGNLAGTPRTASIRCFGPGAAPLSADAMDQLRSRLDAPPSRPMRRYGGWRRASAESEYLATRSGYFHALRPLNFVLDTSCAPLRRYLQQLLTSVACRAYSPAPAKGTMHFSIWIDGDGEACRVYDERGCEHALGDLPLLETPRGDGLHVLALLLTVLSQSDRPLSSLIG